MHGFIGEFDLAKGVWSKMLKSLFDEAEAHTIINVEDNDFAVGTAAGLYVINLESGEV